MSIFFLNKDPVFPHPSLADPDGLLAVGGDLSVKRLISSYSQGIFPWYGPGSPILWWFPEPRLVLNPASIHIQRSLRRILNSGTFRISADTAFEQVIENCACVPRPGGLGTWLLPEMIDAYIQLHEKGFAHSFEAWQGSKLVGGIYGVGLGRAFFGESMFYLVPNASKIALVHLVRFLQVKGYHFMDCQQTTRHMLRFGAKEISGKAFLKKLQAAVSLPGTDGNWTCEAANTFMSDN